MKAMLTILALFIAVHTASALQHGPLTYTIYGEEITISSCDRSTSGEVIIPDEIGGLPVTAISQFAFYDCRQLTKVAVPASVQRIDGGAFRNCSQLESINLPDGITSLESDLFAG